MVAGEVVRPAGVSLDGESLLHSFEFYLFKIVCRGYESSTTCEGVESLLVSVW